MCFTQFEFHNAKPSPKLGPQTNPSLKKMQFGGGGNPALYSLADRTEVEGRCIYWF